MTTTLEDRHRQISDHISKSIIPLINTMDMSLVAALTTTDRAARTTTALAWRGRTRADAVRFTHAADIAERMGDLFTTASERTRLTVDHLDLIWSRIHRHLVTVPTSLVSDVRTSLDTAVEPAVSDWLDNHPGTGTVNLADLRDRLDLILADIAPGLTNATARAEREAANLTRRGNVLTLTCGDTIMAAGIDNALTDRAKNILTDLRKIRDNNPESTPELPTRAEVKAQVLLDLLGDNPDSLAVTVNLFRTTTDGVHGTGTAYSPDIGWLDVDTADRLESAARTSPNGRIRTLPDSPDDLTVTEAYKFPVLVQIAAEARDGHCRFPGCTVPATRCEKDHIENSPHTDPTSDGATSIDNLENLCPEHHRAKTLGIWKAASPDRGLTIHWTGPLGEKYTTYASGPTAPYIRLRAETQSEEPEPEDPPRQE
ncbi:HNH endonuclease signature motif containing protein [Corynebacterium variabile]|uniref:HNH endonuclease signature motif containing protein n=1 Tax=Corynebacterium variabile TaxID=1727 RepID=UPI003F9E6542